MRLGGRVLVILGLLFALTGCGGESRELVVYSGRSRELIEPLLTRIAKEEGIPVAVKYGDTRELAVLLSEEGGRSSADVFISQAPGATGFLLEQGLLAPIAAQQLRAVPERFRGPGGEWVGLSGRLRVLVYNRDMVAEADLPESVLGMTAPQFAGKVGVAPTNASFQDFVTAMRQLEGEETTAAWLRAMADADSPIYANNNAIVEAVSRGEIPMGLVNHYYNVRFLAEDPSLPSRNHVFPGGDAGSVLLETTASVLKTSDRPQDAARLVAALLSPDAQRYFAEETYEYPLVEGVGPAADLPPLDPRELPNIDLRTLGEDYQASVEMIQRSGLGG